MTEQNESQEGSNPSTFEGDVVGTMDSDVLEEELLADLQPQDEIGEEEDLTPNNDFCFTEDDFLEARTNMNEATRHAGSYNQTWSKIRALTGDTVEVKHSEGNVMWTIVGSVEDDIFADRREAELKLFRDNFCPFVDAGECDDAEDLSKMFWYLWPVKAGDDLDKLNEIIEKENASNKETFRRTLKKVSMGEFIIFHSLLIAASIFPQQGDKLWMDQNKNKKPRGIMKAVDFGQHMRAWRFCQIKSLIPRIMESEELRLGDDDWWQFKDRVAKFNANRKEKVYASYALVFDETMSAYVPR